MKKLSWKEKMKSTEKNLEALVRERTASLQKAVNGTIETIAKIFEYKDPYTAGP